MYITLDGRAEFPKYAGSDDPESGVIDDEMWRKRWKSIDTLLLGRRAYEDWARFWPPSKRKPSDPEFIKEFSRFAHDCKKVVFSNSLRRATWKNSRVVGGDVVEVVSSLKKEPGDNIAVGGGPLLAQQFMQHGLVDDYFLTVLPVLLGNGKPFYGSMDEQQNLRLVDVKRSKHGELFLHYKPSDGSRHSREFAEAHGRGRARAIQMKITAI
ncbi:MAG: dihydrofolate reductase family protein [Nitrososphaerales archaeon]